ncbi:hypothetical protein [Rhodoferax sp.]|uniref:hypothetical protein n=1 Tax=Rhodoferax sp. TaxID=50421 RepID=UPI002848D758|nr:hypothetical protein [Rhodoferax sp.]MDR3368504.1 hypothetical protein [Rhodoferax sp.]
MVSFFVSTHVDAVHDSRVDEAKVRWLRFKASAVQATVESDFASASFCNYLPSCPPFYADGCGNWVVCAGTWLHKTEANLIDPAGLLARYLVAGAEVLARELEGVFSIIISDARSQSLKVITDPMGSLHTYLRQTAQGFWVSTSSIAISDNQKLDPVGLAEYLNTGIIYEDRSLWLDVNKLGPATVTVIQGSKLSTSRYWQIARALEHRLSLNDASEAMMANLVATLKQLGNRLSPGVSDLTGGYDSRLLLCGILESGIDFDYTVAGANDSQDVLTAKAIARQLGLKLHHIRNVTAFSMARFEQAISLSDGEYNAFDYARILDSQGPLSERFAMSLNGSFGEVARGYWWELLWPYMERMQPLDADMLARKRFAAVSYVEVMRVPPFISLTAHISGVIRRTLEPYKDLPMGSQMDAVYLTMRMQRWQGRIASNTNQIWPSLSPLGFTNVLSPILAAAPSARFRSLMPRHIFSKWNHLLATIPLEHGYPPAEVSLRNFYKFAPIFGSYFDKVVNKVGPHVKQIHSSPALHVSSVIERYGDLLKGNGIDLLQLPRLLASGLFDEGRLQGFIHSSPIIDGPALQQWQRLISLEYTLQKYI